MFQYPLLIQLLDFYCILKKDLIPSTIIIFFCNSVNNLSKLDRNKSKLKQKFYIVIFLLIIITTNFVIADVLRTDLYEFVWRAGDATYIGVAHSFSKDFNFNSGFMSTDVVNSQSIDSLIEEFPTISYPYGSKGPLYFGALGLLYLILDTQPNDIYHHASIFGTILNSVFLILFFFFLKTKFDIKIAFFSSLLVVFIPYFVWMGAKVHPFPLLMIFSVALLFFLKNKNYHYIFAGVFSSLAILTHPFGISAGISYTIFLLLKKEFKGLTIAIVFGLLTLTPFLALNFYNFGDIGWGLYIPFTDTVSEYFRILLNTDSQVRSYPIAEILAAKIQNPYPALPVFEQVFVGFTNNYKMDYFVIFLFLSSLTFFKLEKLKKHALSIIPFISVLILGYYVIFHQQEIILHGFMAFILPIILIWLLYKKYRFFFDDGLTRTHLFIAIFLYVHILTIYVTSIFLNRIDPESRQLVPALIFMVPFVLIGLGKIQKIIKTRSHSQKIFYLILLLIFVPLMFQTVQGIIHLENYTDSSNNFQSEGTKKVNQIINENFPLDTKIASNRPGYTYVNTGKQTIGFPHEEITTQEFEKFLNNYEISYLVSYDHTVSSIPSVAPLFTKIKEWQPYQYYYTEFYNDGNSQILQVKNLLDAKISEPVLYIFKAIRLENEGKLNEANTIYKQIRELNPKNISISEKICSTLTFVYKFEHSIHSCNVLLKNDANNLIALSNLVISYAENGQKEKVFDVLGLYDDIFSNEPNNEKALKSWTMTFLHLISVDDEYQKIIDKMFDNAKKLEELHDYQKALIQYNFLSHLTEADLQFSIDSSYAKIRILTKLERYDDAFNVYDATIQIYNNEIRKLIIANQYNEVNDMQKSMINVMKGKVTLLINLEDFHKAYRVYLEILDIDKFDPDVYKKIAAYHEKYGKLKQALHNYERALHLQPENDYLLEKIKELKDKIAV